MTLILKPGTSWDEVYARARAIAPEAFDGDRILNLIGGEWKRLGSPGDHVTPVDGSPIQGPPRIDHDDAVAAVAQARGRAQGVGGGGPRRAQGAGQGRRGRDAGAPRDPGPAAGLGDRQAVAAGLRRRRPRAGRRRLVPPGDRAAAGRAHPAAGSGVQHRVVELPDVGAGPRRAGAVPGRQRRGRQDPVAGRLPLPDPGARDHAATGTARHAAVRCRQHPRRRAHQRAGDRGAGVRRRSRQRPQGRDDPGRHRQAALPRAGGAERLGHLGLHRLGRPGRAPEEGLRVRQAALHGLPALRRPARARARVPGDVPARRAVAALRSPAGRRDHVRPAARPRLRPGHPRHQGRRAAGALRQCRQGRGASRCTTASSPTVASSTARTPARTSHPLRCSHRRATGRCSTPSRSARWTASSSSTPRTSCSLR